jgi:hypothetical protein
VAPVSSRWTWTWSGRDATILAPIDVPAKKLNDFEAVVPRSSSYEALGLHGLMKKAVLEAAFSLEPGPISYQLTSRRAEPIRHASLHWE